MTYIGGLAGEVVDVINQQNLEQHWFDNSEFAKLHTSSTRVKTGTPNNGLNARFDFILPNGILASSNYYVDGTYTTFGNDGNHFQDSISTLPNGAVSPLIAKALHDASEHLPIYLDLRFVKKTSNVVEEKDWTDLLLDLW